MHRRNLSAAKNEFTTQKIRQEWAEHEQEQLGAAAATTATSDWIVEPATADTIDAKPEQQQQQPSEPTISNIHLLPEQCDPKKSAIPKSSSVPIYVGDAAPTTPTMTSASTVDLKDEQKSKKKRRKKSVLRRKSTSTQSMPTPQRKIAFCHGSAPVFNVIDRPGNDTNGSSTPSDDLTQVQNGSALTDFHFFSDGEANGTPHGSRPSTPIKSDSELEVVTHWNRKAADDIMNTSASWKWGELPTPAPALDDAHGEVASEEVQQQRRISMISNVFSFMKQSNQMRKKSTTDGVYLSDLEMDDPEIGAMYFPPISQRPLVCDTDDHESGNGTSLPHSPSSIGSPKSGVDSDFEEGKYDDHK